MGWLFGGCLPKQSSLEPGARTAAADQIERFRLRALAPSHLPPPSVVLEGVVDDPGAMQVRARLVLAEDAPWNQWSDQTARLFNNRAAFFVAVEVSGDGPVRWDPAGTWLEVNEPGNRLSVAPTSELLLGALFLHAVLQERFGLEGDLVDRTRGAGAFRSAYLPQESSGALLQGLLAFPLEAPDASFDPSHAVALRLLLAVADADGERTLIVTFL